MKIPVIKNTFTNYLKMMVTLFEGILVARWLIGFLGMESYGLWALLWSFFGYAVLLDFGCGAAVQKYTSGGMYERDPNEYGRVISTILTFHACMALVIAGVTIGCGFFLQGLLKITDPVQLAQAKSCFLLFGLGAALLFPTGIFPEILVGLQKIYLRNLVIVSCKLVELAGVLIIFWCGGNLVWLIAFVMVLTLLNNVVMGWFVVRLMPGIRFRFGWDSGKWKEVAGFSAVVYLGVLSNLILRRSSRLVISIFCGVTEVGVFQLSSKLADLCSQAVSQYQENVGPITGALYKRKKFAALGQIVFGAMRWNAFSATGVILIAYILSEQLLEALFKITPENTENFADTVSLSRWFLFSYYISIVLRYVPQKYFLMSERHRYANYLLFGEAIANLGLSLALIRFYGVVSVLWVSIGIKLVISLFFFMPTLVRSLAISSGNFILQIFVQPFVAGVPAAGWAWFWGTRSGWGAWTTIFLGGAGAGVLYLIAMLFLCPLPRKFDRFLPKTIQRIQNRKERNF